MQDLILIPTAFERSRIAEDFLLSLKNAGLALELCRFGLVASSVQASHLLSRYQPRRVILLGIAGLYRHEPGGDFQIGDACVFSHVGCFGIGVGQGPNFQSASRLGWSQIQSTNPSRSDSSQRDSDVIELAPIGPKSPSEQSWLLASVPAASADEQEARGKLEIFPNAVAEDMEGFGVALACQVADVPLTIVRGFSNWVGDRNHENWKVTEALHSACRLILESLAKRHK